MAHSIHPQSFTSDASIWRPRLSGPPLTEAEANPGADKASWWHKRLYPTSQHSGTTSGLPEYDAIHGKDNGGIRSVRLNWWLRIYSLVSFASLAAAIGFLSWLWFTPDSVTWRRLMLGPHATQSVTIAAVVVQGAVTLLAGVATSMIASLAVERRGIPPKDVAKVSIARCANSGPTSVFILLFGSTFETSLRLAAGLLLVTTLASQFTSTMLVQDMTPGPVVDFPSEISNSYTLNHNMSTDQTLPSAIAGQVVDYWLRRPSAWESFAEYHEPVDSDEDVEDTGPTIRAFLPIAQQADREQLHEFHGMARVVDARVICVRPEIEDLHFCPESKDGLNSFGSICGTASRSTMPGGMGFMSHNLTRSNMKVKFICPLHSPHDDRYKWMACGFDGWGSKIITSLSNSTSPTDDTYLGDGSYLVMDSGTTFREIRRAMTNLTNHYTGTSGSDMTWNYEDMMRHNTDAWEFLNATKSGPWLELSSRASVTNGKAHSTWDFNMKMSVCYDTFGRIGPGINHLNITAATQKTLQEPKYKYTYNETVDSYDVTPIRNQLGAVKNTTSKTGLSSQALTILSSDMTKSFRDVRGKPMTPPYFDNLGWLQRTAGLLSSNIAFCPFSIEYADFKSTDVVLAQIFTDTMERTNSPALAMQAAKTIVVRVAYYDIINSFMPDGHASISQFRQISIPQAYRGYGTVIGITIVHTILFFFLFNLFLGTKYSFPDNTWHTVAQVSESPEMRRILKDACMVTDETVEKRLKSGGSGEGSCIEKQITIVDEAWHNGEPLFAKDENGYVRLRSVR